MESNTETSEICEFYKGKHILLTGATGFLGKLIVEKLLRACKPAMIYLIVRTKKSQDPHHRLKEFTESKLFHRLKKKDPSFIERLKIVPGEVSAPGLGLSSADTELLLDKVEVVFHGAATVKFNEHLATAIRINIGGTRSILQLCKRMKNLECVVHISTAYSHCPRKEIAEVFYDTPVSSEGLIALADNFNPQLLDEMTPSIIGDWSNTYVFTKAVAEECIKKNGEGLPLSIMRPGIIVTTRNEPIPNWVDHLYGPIGIATGCYIGAVRVVRVGKEDKGELMPADMTVNCLLAIGVETAKSGYIWKSEEIPIYNWTSHPNNRVTWTELLGYLKERGNEIPYSHTYCHYSSILTVRNFYVYYVLSFFLHILPGTVIDFVLIFLHKKPRLLDLYSKIHKGMDLVGYFSTQTWMFSMNRTINLWNSLNDEDKRLFDFDMESLDYKSFLRGNIDGISEFIAVEEGKDMAYAKRRYFVIYIVDCIARVVFFAGLLWCLWRIAGEITDYWL